MRSPAFVVALVACSHSRDIRHANEVEGEVELEGANGQLVDAVAVASQGGVAFQAADGSWVPADRIAKIKDTRHARGAFEGLGIGALAGFAVGAVVGYADGDDDCGDHCWFALDAEEKAILGGFAVGLLGAVVGAVAGGVIGSTVVYERQPGNVSFRPVGPKGSAVGMSLDF